jgi:hypothetical protein
MVNIRRANSSRNAENRSRSGSISVEKRKSRDEGGISISIFYRATAKLAPSSAAHYAQSAKSLRAPRQDSEAADG